MVGGGGGGKGKSEALDITAVSQLHLLPPKGALVKEAFANVLA